MFTIFTPLAGRLHCWNPYQDFLTNQCWPHDDIKIILVNTSKSEKFKKIVKTWIEKSDYNITYIEDFPPIENLGLKKRSLVHNPVKKYLGNLYNKIIPMIDTEYLWCIDDDTIPPYNACKLLMNGFTSPKIFSVSGAYLLNKDQFQTKDYYCAWGNPNIAFLKEEKGITKVGGNGLGCVILKLDKNFDFTWNKNISGGMDEQFYVKQTKLGKIAKINWDVKCEHLGNEIPFL